MTEKLIATCEGCRFWKFYPDGNAEPYGDCRRNTPLLAPPDLVAEGAFDITDAVWPTTMGDDWCGEHEPRHRIDPDPLG